MTKTLILGLGNPVLTDDGVGWRVAEVLEPELCAHPGVDVHTSCRGGLSLMEELVGYDRAIIVDAIRAGSRAGTIHRLHPDDLPTQHSASAHDASLATALTLGRQAGAHLPDDDRILLIGVEAEDVTTFGEDCTPDVRAAVPLAARAVMDALAGGEIESRIEQEVANR